MRSQETAELAWSSLACLQQGIDGLRQLAEMGLDADELTDLVGGAFACRSAFDSAVTSLVGALDERVEERRRRRGEGDDPTTSCSVLLRDQFNLTNNAAYAQVRLARQLRELPGTASAFSDGRLSNSPAPPIARTLDPVVLR